MERRVLFRSCSGDSHDLLRRPVPKYSIARGGRRSDDGPVRSNEARWQFVGALDATVGLAGLTVEILPEQSGFVDHFGDAIDSFVVAARSANGL